MRKNIKLIWWAVLILFLCLFRKPSISLLRSIMAFILAHGNDEIKNSISMILDVILIVHKIWAECIHMHILNEANSIHCVLMLRVGLTLIDLSLHLKSVKVSIVGHWKCIWSESFFQINLYCHLVFWLLVSLIVGVIMVLVEFTLEPKLFHIFSSVVVYSRWLVIIIRGLFIVRLIFFIVINDFFLVKKSASNCLMPE